MTHTILIIAIALVSLFLLAVIVGALGMAHEMDERERMRARHGYSTIEGRIRQSYGEQNDR